MSGQGQTLTVCLCPVCGSDRVQAEAWAYINTGDLVDFAEHGENFCDDCEEHSKHLCVVLVGPRGAIKGCTAHGVLTADCAVWHRRQWTKPEIEHGRRRLVQYWKLAKRKARRGQLTGLTETGP